MAENYQLAFFTIGHRLARQLESSNAYFYNEEGVADLHQAMCDYYYLDRNESHGYGVREVKAKLIDPVNGPDLIVSSVEGESNRYQTRFAFIYDCLIPEDDFAVCPSFQAKVFFDNPLAPECVNLFRQTLEMITEQLDTTCRFAKRKPFIALGLHQNIVQKFSQYSTVLSELGLQHCELPADKNAPCIFHSMPTPNH